MAPTCLPKTAPSAATQLRKFPSLARDASLIQQHVSQPWILTFTVLRLNSIAHSTSPGASSLQKSYRNGLHATKIGNYRASTQRIQSRERAEAIAGKTSITRAPRIENPKYASKERPEFSDI
jgi:hypothetical protein